MARFRSILFWIHLVAGVFSATVVLIMSVTGVALTYQKQMTLWADLRGVNLTPPDGVARLTNDSLVALVVAREGKSPSSVVWRSFTYAPVEFQFGREGRQFVSPYTGEVLSTGSTGMREFFTKMTDWHRWLAMSGDSRPTGRKITGYSNLAFLVLVLTGMYLWWPRTLRWNAFKPVLWFRRRLSPKAREFNWHNVIGIWSAIPLAVVVASGAVISFPWASDLVYKAAGEAPPPRAEAPAPARPEARGGGAGGTGAEGGSRGVEPVAVGDPAALAAQQMEDWRAMSLTWPRNGKAPLVFSVDRGMGGEPQKKGSLTVARSGEIESWQPFAEQSAGRRARSWMRFLHTGEALGVVGQTIAGIVSLGGAFLVYTGIALSLRRFAAWRRRTAGAA
ncbi:MAG TPA: PepSY-associated TM helix domain-containing protein [Gemmatimonas sp.]|uniref:PepSY-associated TM helix domain-containing protein n=1 Tax=Gemmatimonas sp. TaxID=1962908 RepID=UPI002EDA3645